MSKELQTKSVNQTPDLAEEIQASATSDPEYQKEWKYILVNGQNESYPKSCHD